MTTPSTQPSFSTDPNRKRIGIFVIAYNAENHIKKTLDRIPEAVWDEIETVFVVDDCSLDETTSHAINYPDPKGKLEVLRNRSNRRYGGNQKFGYQHAIRKGLDIVVMLHADGQYAPELLPDMLLPLKEDRADVVLGSRMMERGNALKGGMPRYKYYGNIILTGIENKLSGMSLTEFHSGYRAYRVDLLKQIPFWENSNEWHFDTHILFQACEAKARILEINIPTYYGDEICHVNGIAYGLNCITSAFGFWLFRKDICYARKFDISKHGSRYGEKFDDPLSSHSVIWNRLQEEDLPKLRVLELGVGDAALTRRLHEAGAQVDGVELDEEAAAIAAPYCQKMFTGDLDRIDQLGLEGAYDIVLAADVLEHLVHPEFVLSKLKTVLRKDGLLIVSLPNIANIYVRLNLLLGRFPTHSKGLLDETHLHCYTLATMRRLLNKTGWVIQSSQVTAIPVAIVFPFIQKAPFRWILHLFHGMTKLWKGLWGYQGIFVCRNPNQPDLL